MWPRLCSDTLIRCRSLLTFGTKALRRRYVTALEALRQCYDKLEHQAGLMASALEALKEAVAPVENRALFTCFASRDFSSFLSDIVSPYEAQLQVWKLCTCHNSRTAPFATDLHASTQSLVLQVYKRIVDAFPRASDLFETEHSGWSRAQLKSTGGFEFGMKEPSDFLSAWDQQQASVRFPTLSVLGWRGLRLSTDPASFVQAMVVTWMLQTKLDTQAMESKLQLLSEDMRTV